MMLTKKDEQKVIKAIKTGSLDYQIVGKTCSGSRWPEGDHYYVINDLINQKTIHILTDALGDDFND